VLIIVDDSSRCTFTSPLPVARRCITLNCIVLTLISGLHLSYHSLVLVSPAEMKIFLRIFHTGLASMWGKENVIGSEHLYSRNY
jgi:hypothetical protein